MGCGPQKPVSKSCLVQEESLDWIPCYYVILLDHCVLGCVPSQVGHAEGIVKSDSEERCACVANLRRYNSGLLEVSVICQLSSLLVALLLVLISLSIGKAQDELPVGRT